MPREKRMLRGRMRICKEVDSRRASCSPGLKSSIRLNSTHRSPREVSLGSRLSALLSHFFVLLLQQRSRQQDAD